MKPLPKIDEIESLKNRLNRVHIMEGSRILPTGALVYPLIDTNTNLVRNTGEHNG